MNDSFLSWLWVVKKLQCVRKGRPVSGTTITIWRHATYAVRLEILKGPAPFKLALVVEVIVVSLPLQRLPLQRLPYNLGHYYTSGVTATLWG